MEATKSQAFTPEDLKAEQQRKLQSDERKQRRQEIQNEIKLVKNDIARLRQLPPDIDQMVRRWGGRNRRCRSEFCERYADRSAEGAYPRVAPVSTWLPAILLR